MAARQEDVQFEGVRAVFLDVDDTLWENNLYFLQSLDWLCRAGRSLGLSDGAVKGTLHQHEVRNIRLRGYGYDSYEASLLATVARLAHLGGAGARHEPLRRRALEWTHFLRRHPIVFCPGVERTLPLLLGHFRVVLVTKGHAGDQMAKVRRSGLLGRVHGVHVVPHKHAANYRAVLEAEGLSAEETVMVGNSPRSDINGAKAAGLRTVYVPHPLTWYMELEAIAPGGPPTARVADFSGVAAVLGVAAADAQSPPTKAAPAC